MARNKITFTKEWTDDSRWEYIFTGSQRQPTLVEARNFIIENHLQDEIEDYFGVVHMNLDSEEWIPPEENLSLVLRGYNGGSGDGCCPICGHERDMSGSKCPVCLRPWE